MARCSKDAPSAKLQRAEIPDVIDGILRRMTLRDPAARYQSADELINSLTPFCSDLTQASLRKAMLDAGLEDPDFVLELADDAEGANQDAGYQQFLKEMDSGASVDLMINTSGGQNQSSECHNPGVAASGFQTRQTAADTCGKKSYRSNDGRGRRRYGAGVDWFIRLGQS
jgi:hypothetical protein